MCQSIWWSGQGLLHEQVSVTFDKGEALCISMQYEIELIDTFEKIAFKFICTLFSLYQIFMMWKPGTGRHFLIAANAR